MVANANELNGGCFNKRNKESWEHNLKINLDRKLMHYFVSCLLVKEVLNDEELHLHAFARGSALVSNLDNKNLYIRLIIKKIIIFFMIKLFYFQFIDYFNFFIKYSSIFSEKYNNILS